MGRGRKRTFNPTIPKHIDQALLPPGIYWDKSGNGRWYVREPRPDGGPPGRDLKAVIVASAKARLSELHDIIEIRRSGSARGTLRWLHAQFQDSTEYQALSNDTRRDYLIHGDAAVAHPTKRGAFGDVQVNAMTSAVIQTLVEDIAKGRPESRAGAGDARRGYPSKANHVLRYLRRLCAWGVRHGHCQNNPGRGVKQTKERKKRQFPKDQAYVSLVEFARERGQLKPHSKGSQPPYLAAVAEIAFSFRPRGVEVCDLNDADILEEGLQNRRGKGSLTNITAWNPRLQAAVAELQARPALC